MKQSICFLLAFALCLGQWGCAAFPYGNMLTEPSTEPADISTQTAAPTETIAPAESTAPTEPGQPSQRPSVPDRPVVRLDWADVYGLLLSNLATMNPGYYGEYCLYDIDGDELPELFVKLGTCEADYQFSVYTMTEAGADLIGTLGGSHASIAGLSGENACLLASGHQGYEQISRLTVENGHLLQELIYEAFSQEYHDLVFLPTYALKQTEGLSWNGNPPDSNRAVLDNFIGRFPYLLEIPFADQSIFSGPSYDYSFVQTVEFAGIYTIMEEQMDGEGNLWGRLKSGVGWVDLTEIQYRIDFYAPISANYADGPLLSSGDYRYCCLDSSEYSFTVAFRAYETLYDIQIHAVSDEPSEALYSLDQLTPDRPLVADIALPGDASAYSIYFSDEEGNINIYILTSSGRNNSLVFYEY